MSYFERAVYTLENLGITDVLLPFLLIFTLVFAVLQKSKILGMDKDGHPHKKFNVTISLIMALGVVIPHITNSYPYNADVVDIINRALPNVSLVVVAIVMFMLLVGIWGKELNVAGSALSVWVTILSIIAILVIFAVAAGWMGDMPYWLRFLEDPETQALVIIIIVFGLIIKFITGEERTEEDRRRRKEALRNVLTDVGESRERE
jgi:hypothetical protein